MQRHAHLFPALNQRPIHGTQEQVLSPPADKRVFDFSEVVEVVSSFEFRVSSLVGHFQKLH
jgi:hypothetical protein